MSKIFITSAEVAALLGLPSALALLHRRQRLEDAEGFPLPMPYGRSRFMWRRDQVERWIEERGRPRAELPPDPGPRPVPANHSLLEEARRA